MFLVLYEIKRYFINDVGLLFFFFESNLLSHLYSGFNTNILIHTTAHARFNIIFVNFQITEIENLTIEVRIGHW